jgi:hypothetical protein
MIAVSVGYVLAWVGGLVLFAAVGWLIVTLVKRGYASFSDFFPW